MRILEFLLKKAFPACATIFLSTLLAGCPGPNGGEVSWDTMGTTATVKWHDNKDFPIGWMAQDTVKRAFDLVEKLLTAHDPNSELSRIAPLSDEEILAKCSNEMRPCYEAAFRLRDQTGGVFNPHWRGPGTMDLGAIAKGFAVDKATECFAHTGVKSGWRILIDLGGNLRAVGPGSWKVGIAGSDETLVLTNGMACATSGEYFRGKHIKDGRTGAAVTNGIYSVTVVHPMSAMLADGLSTTLFVLGKDEGEKFLKKFYPEAKAHWVMK